MSQSAHIKIEGLEGVIREIKTLADDKVKRKEMLKILRRQMKPIHAAVQSRANEQRAEHPIKVRGVTYDPGNLAKSIKLFTGRKKTDASIYVGPADGHRGRKPKFDGFYGWWIIYGSAKHSPPDDFIWKAAAPLMESVNTTMSRETERYIERKIKKLNL